MRDCLWHFLDRWDKVTVGYEQAKDALKLFNNMAELPDQATTETVYGLLNFFDSLGRMANHHHIDDDITWFYFHDDAHELWELAEKYVTSERLTAGDLGITWWQDYESWVVRIRRIEDSECKKQKKRAEKSARRRGLTSPPGPPTSQPGPPTANPALRPAHWPNMYRPPQSTEIIELVQKIMALNKLKPSTKPKV